MVFIRFLKSQGQRSVSFSYIKKYPISRHLVCMIRLNLKSREFFRIHQQPKKKKKKNPKKRLIQVGERVQAPYVSFHRKNSESSSLDPHCSALSWGTDGLQQVLQSMKQQAKFELMVMSFFMERPYTFI